METDLFTNVNKKCPSCDTQSAQAVTLRVPKLGNCLEMYTCAQASAQSVHVLCTSLGTPCTLVLLLGHSLYTRATAWALLVCYTGTAWILLAHYTGTTWVLLVHIQCNDLGTLSTLQGYCFSTLGTLELHAWVLLANKLPLACPPLVHYLKSYTCAL